MSDAAQTFTRVRDSDLPRVSLDYLDEQAALLELSPRQYVAWRRLLLHLHKYGELPVGLKALAGICKVGPRAFEAMAPVLGHHFDCDPQGRWTHRDILEGRGDRPVVPAIEVAASVSDLSAKRSVAGKLGNERRWGKDQRHLQVVEGDKANPAGSPASEVGGPIANSANPIAKGIANGVDLPTGFAATLRSVATDSPSSLTSLSDGLSDSVFQEEGEGSGAGADARNADRKIVGIEAPEDRKSDRKTADPRPSSAVATASDPVVKLLTSGSPVAITTAVLGGASGAGRAPDALPYTVGESFSVDPPVVAPPLAFSTDEAIITALRGAGGANIPVVLLTPQGIEPIRELVRTGCDLKRDIVPAIQATVPSLRQPLKSLRASFIRDAALAKRDDAVRAIAASPANQVKVYEGTPQAEAYRTLRGGKSLFFTAGEDGRRFRYESTEWPPGHAPTPTA